MPQSDEELTQITGPCTAQEAEVHGFCHPNVEPRGAPRRRKITQAEFSSLARGGKLQDHEVYVGRGGRGVPPSKWGNPFRIGPSCTRSEAITRFRGHFKDRNMIKDIRELVGKDLLCHCSPEEGCHGDYLMAMVHHCVPQEVPSMSGFVDDGLPVRLEVQIPALPLV